MPMSQRTGLKDVSHIVSYKYMKGKRHLKHRKGHAHKKKGRTMTMVNRMPKQMHTVVAPKFLTELEYGFTGTAQMGAGIAGYFNIWANGISFPGENGGVAPGDFNPFTQTAGVNLGVGGIVYPAVVALTALQPVGETMLASLYDKYRVWKSKMAVTVTGTGGNSIVTLVPIVGASLQVGIPGVDIQRAQSLPYSKAITVSANNNIKQNRIASSCVPHVILGETRQQYLDDPNTAGIMATSGGLPPISDSSNQVFWQVNIAPFASTQVTLVDVEVRVTYVVELFDPLGPTDV